MYLDAAYVAKFYLNEPDSTRVRAALQDAGTLVTSSWSIAEVSCVFHRHVREGRLSVSQFQDLMRVFLDHVVSGLWTLLPVTDAVLRRTALLISGAPATIFLRAGDAVHLASALEAGEAEVWASDRQLLAAAPQFGLTGRTA